MNVPYRTNEQIWCEVERFRLATGVAQFLGPPCQTMEIAELTLRLNAVPFPGLYKKFKQDAAITPDLKDLYLDEDFYEGYERGAKWIDQRIRFSIAHEIGHWAMHAVEIRANQFASQEAFKFWMGEKSNFAAPEYQADEFAGRLLVPRESLIEWYDKYAQDAEARNPQWWEDGDSRQALAMRIAPRFGVNYRVIETRMDREGLWPASEICPRGME